MQIVEIKMCLKRESEKKLNLMKFVILLLSFCAHDFPFRYLWIIQLFRQRTCCPSTNTALLSAISHQAQLAIKLSILLAHLRVRARALGRPKHGVASLICMRAKGAAAPAN